MSKFTTLLACVAALVSPLLLVKTAESSGSKLNLQDTPIEAAAQEHGLDPLLVYAVALVESAKFHDETTLSPWPWALAASTESFYGQTKEHALEKLKILQQQHGNNIDVGLMQVNLRWHGHRVSEPAELLDMATNLRVASAILAQSMASAPADMALGIGRYHHWKDEARARRYGQRVINIWRNLKNL